MFSISEKHFGFLFIFEHPCKLNIFSLKWLKTFASEVQITLLDDIRYNIFKKSLCKTASKKPSYNYKKVHLPI
jgi:hypothetical protein